VWKNWQNLRPQSGAVAFRERLPRLIVDENGKERLSIEDRVLGHRRDWWSRLPAERRPSQTE